MFGSKHKREGERNSRSKGMRDNREVTERGEGERREEERREGEGREGEGMVGEKNTD